MQFDIELIRAIYGSFSEKVKRARAAKGAPLTLAEKILYAHLFAPSSARPFRRGEDYVDFRPDRVAMQDATAQMALLQFMNAGRDRSAMPAITSTASAPPTPIAIMPSPPAFGVCESVPIIMPPGKA